MCRVEIMRIMARVMTVAMLALSGVTWALAAEDIHTLNEQSVQLSNQGKYAEAIAVARRALSLAEKTLGATHPNTLTIVNNLGMFYSAQGRFSEAEPLYKRALKGTEAALGATHPSTLISVNNLAALYQNLGRLGEAEILFKRALKGYEKTLGPADPATLQGGNNLAALFQVQGRYGEAETLYKRAVKGNEKALGPADPATLMSVSNLAFLYQNQGRYGEAEPLYRRALKGFEKALGPAHPSTLLSVNNLGLLYSDQGRHEEAEPLYRRALKGYEAALGPAHPITLLSVSNLGLLYAGQGRYGEAEPLYRRALKGYEVALGPSHPSTLVSVNNLAGLYAAQGRFGEAETLYQRTFKGYEAALGPTHPTTLLSINNLAGFYDTQGRYGEAEPLFKRALVGHEQTLGPAHPATLRSVNNLGGLYERQGRHGEARSLYERALAGREKVLGTEHPDTLNSVNNLAALSFTQSDWPRAAQLWRRSTAVIAGRVQRAAADTGLSSRKTSEAQQLDWQFWGLVKTAYRLVPEGRAPDAALSGEMFEAAQWALESETARSLAQMAARGAKGDAALAALVRERQDLAGEWRRREQTLAVALGQDAAKRDAKAEAAERERMTDIDRRIAEIDRRLKAEFKDYYARAYPGPLSVEEVQAQLGPDEAIVLFLDTPDPKPTPEETFIWVVTKTQMRWLRSDLGKSALVREVGALRCGLDQAAWGGQSRCPELTGLAKPGALLPFDPARANRLYTELFGQAEDLIKGKHLLIVPSGALAQLPFAVLVTASPKAGEKTAWLARRHAITVLPAVSSLKALRATGRLSAAPEPLVGFGNPLLDGPDSRYVKSAALARDKQSCPKSAWRQVAEWAGLREGVGKIERRSGLANVAHLRQQMPLPETADELCAVARDIGANLGAIHLGAHATEHDVKAMSESGALARYRIVHFATHGAMAGELSLASEPGLILTPPGTASADDDGYLSASEIADLKVDADWVILSACNTAAGQTSNAEALSGLARAFIYAQARALLVSHWAVDSNATVKIITSAMREVAPDRKVGRAEALRRAMLALIDGGDAREAHPSSWAPFIVVGEGAL
jgi:CHAT domain-containing protein/tetratricopeptide (TPR) repeat protein